MIPSLEGLPTFGRWTKVPLEDGHQSSSKRKLENPNSGLCERELAKPVINLQSSRASKKIQSTELGKIPC